MTGHIIMAGLWRGYNHPELGIKLTNFEYSQLAEQAIANKFADMFTQHGVKCSVTEHTVGYDPRYDFRINNTKIELKISGNLIKGKQTLPIETKSKSPTGVEPSGLSTTEADAYLFVTAGMWADDIVMKWRFLPVALLKRFVDFEADTALTGEDSKGYQSLGCKLKIDRQALISGEEPFGDGMFAFGPCLVDQDKPWAFSPDETNLFRKNKQLLSAIGDMIR